MEAIRRELMADSGSSKPKRQIDCHVVRRGSSRGDFLAQSYLCF